MSDLSFLEWDSSFFSEKIGKITCYETDTEDYLTQLLQKAKQEGYQLIYLFDASKTKINDSVCSNFNGKLVDTKIIFKKSITQKKRIVDSHIQSYLANDISKEINELAYLSGTYSRFKIDENFTSKNFIDLYDEWVRKSITREIADEVFVYIEQSKILGFVTVSVKNNIGSIGLIAVNPKHQGKKIGSHLLNQVELFLTSKNITELQVPTQKANQLACDFYIRNGFEKKSNQNIYHFNLM